MGLNIFFKNISNCDLFFNKSQLNFLIICFLFLPIIGILTHEIGHYLTAKFFNQKAIVHYNSTSHFSKKNDSIFNYCDTIIKLNKEYDCLKKIKQINYENNLITLSGVLVTYLISITGILIIFFKFNKTEVISRTYIFILCQSFFSLRGLINAITYLFNDSFQGSDEFKIAIYLHFDPFFFMICITFLNLFLNIFLYNLINIKIRLIFIVLMGFFSSLGYIIWSFKLGKLLLP